ARREGVLVTVGVEPDRPETGYGYIQPGTSLGGDAWRVGAFHEKPDEATARSYAEAGYLWNTGIFVWSAATFLGEVRRHAAEIAPHLERLEGGDVHGFFDAVEPVSVDVAVLERSERVAVVRATFDWDDVGTWASLARGHEPDEGGNVRVGGGTVVDGRGNVVYADGAPVVLWGVDDLVVVRTEGMTLVTKREMAADLKELLSRLPSPLRDFER
ncbi:MAG: mannose-1-phosphate guanylyltransferase, partial [Gemmatimonadetes bacterium]|nr:mannose-1-phosphate guanylyltransferase [Gemmatimonadota bacterium]